MNIFQLKGTWLKVIEMAEQMDEETLQDTLESIEEPTKDKVANAIAAEKQLDADIKQLQEYKKDIDARIKARKNAKERVRAVIETGLEIVGEHKKDKQGNKTGHIKAKFDKPWVGSAWTQDNPPKAKYEDVKKVPKKYRIEQPDKVDTKAIIEDWKKDKDKKIRGVEIEITQGVRYR